MAEGDEQWWIYSYTKGFCGPYPSWSNAAAGLRMLDHTFSAVRSPTPIVVSTTQVQEMIATFSTFLASK